MAARDNNIEYNSDYIGSRYALPKVGEDDKFHYSKTIMYTIYFAISNRLSNVEYVLLEESYYSNLKLTINSLMR